MSWSEADIPDLSGKTIVVTGANSGIGLGACGLFAAHGARVVLACRSQARGEEALATLRGEMPAADLELSLLDLASLASVRDFAERFAGTHGRLDVLCNNAGVMAIPRRLTEDGFEMQLGVNHLGHFALTGRLLATLLSTTGSRVVNVSSTAQRVGRIAFDDLMGERSYQKWRAYGQSKLANMLFTHELQRRLAAAAAETLAVVCHPGYANTNLQYVGPRLEGSRLGEMVMGVGNRLFAQSADEGAWPTVYAATEPGLRGGEYVGPGGLMQLRGPPVQVSPSRAARDDEAARRLWERSVELTGVDYGALTP